MQRAGMRAVQRRRELQAEEARIRSERETLTRTRTRAESYALIAAAVVGAVSLAVSAWGTYWTAQVAEDQLAQSKEQDADKKKDQASRAIFWVEGAGVFPGIGTRLVITNQSQYPLTLLTGEPQDHRAARRANRVVECHEGGEGRGASLLGAPSRSRRPAPHQWQTRWRRSRRPCGAEFRVCRFQGGSLVAR